ncbi:MAG: hypothetical protein ACLQVX_12760 [Limisphaerales bacterium]
MRKRFEHRRGKSQHAGQVSTASSAVGCLRLVALRLALGLLVWTGVAEALRAAPQFDVFLGYDGIVPEGSWFPMACEIKNDGPSFMGVVEVSLAGYGQRQGQVLRVPVELPTGTLKRLFIPVFSSSRGFSSWDARLLDERGRVRAEQPGLQPRKKIACEAPLLGALTRTPAGAPVFRPLPSRAGGSDMQPVSARLQLSIFPDNPLMLEGMGSIYLNSSQAPEMKLNQVNALYGWLHAGGHLIVGVEQISDITSTPWLRNLFPCELKEMRTVQSRGELQDWLSSPRGMPSGKLKGAMVFAFARNRPGQFIEGSAAFGDAPDTAFDSAELQVAGAAVLEGQAVVSSQDGPLVVTANRGRGRVTALLFSPEREPVRSWKNLPTFWAKLTEVPAEWYGPSPQSNFGGGMSSDGIFGAMLDSRQVHKLPVEWLLLLLIVYLVVIGPLDQYWLKRIRKPMLTWITFPCYVVLFSLLIYFIGYKLRSGESEWNELHVVDVLLNGDRAELRGRTYASIYSPSNQRYDLASEQKYATFRNEFAGMWGGGQSSERANVFQTGDSFRAEVFVPVWISELFVSDWWQPSEAPLDVSVAPAPGGWKVTVVNQAEDKLSNTQVVIEDRIFGLGEVAPGKTRTFQLARQQGQLLTDFLSTYGARFRGAVQSRKQAFGSTESARIDDVQRASVAASFPSLLSLGPDMYSRFVSPPGLDVTPVVAHGGVMFFAWAGGYSPVKPINQFSPRRFHQNTLWRVATTVK